MSPTHGHVTDLFLELEFQHKGNKNIINVNSQQNIAVFSIAIDSENKIIQLLHRKGQKIKFDKMSSSGQEPTFNTFNNVINFDIK